MLFKPNMIVIVLNGRLAGKKAVVVKVLDNQNIIIAGINRVPKAVEDYMPAWEKRKNEKFLAFIKKINVKHVIATRYKAEVGLVNLAVEEAVNDLKLKAAANEEANKILKGAYEAKKAKWLFTPLKF